MINRLLGVDYASRHNRVLVPLAERLAAHLIGCISHLSRIDRISARAKNPERFELKAMKRDKDGNLKYTHPFDQIQDIVGARVIVFYLQDVEAVSAEISRYYRSIEARDLIPESLREFGYVGRHFILALPEDIVASETDKDEVPTFFELQVKTLFQHAWSEAEHDIAYKPVREVTDLHRRQIAFTAAQAWGADQIFSQLQDQLSI